MEWYDNFFETALALNDGDIQKSEFMLDCSIYAFYYRCKKMSEYLEKKNKKD